MKVYKGSFKKKNGEIRKMLFARLDEIPESFLNERIIGSGISKNYPDGMELVFDIEEDAFRTFNWATSTGSVEEFALDPSHFD